MKIYGLTGGIASGKSTVLDYFRACGAAVLSADAIYHQLLAPHQDQPSPLATAIATLFADLPLLDEQHQLRREVLAKAVFAQKSPARLALQALVHPCIRQHAEQLLSVFAQQGFAIALYEVPLLFESQLTAQFHRTILVWVPLILQRQRLQARHHLTAAEIEARLAAQWPLQDKKQLADYVIDNSNDFLATQKQVTKLYQLLLKN